MPIVIDEPEEEASKEDKDQTDDDITVDEAIEAGVTISPSPAVDTIDLDIYPHLMNIIRSSTAALEWTSDSDETLGATIEELSQKIEAIEHTLGSVSGTVTSLPRQLDTNLQEQLETTIAPLRSEVESIKSDVVPQLEAAQSSIKKVEGFMRENVDFLVSSVEIKGTLHLLQGEFESLARRITNVEATLDKSWDRRFTRSALIVATIMAVLAVIQLFL